MNDKDGKEHPEHQQNVEYENKRKRDQESLFSGLKNMANKAKETLGKQQPFNLKTEGVDMDKMKDYLKEKQEKNGYKFEEDPETGRIKVFNQDNVFLFEYGADPKSGKGDGGYRVDSNNPDSIKAAAEAHMATNPDVPIDVPDRTPGGMKILNTLVNDTEVKLTPESFKGWGNDQEKVNELYDQYQKSRGLDQKPAMDPAANLREPKPQ